MWQSAQQQTGRWRFLALAIGTIGLGLLVHFHGTALPPATRDVLGDALWAMMVVWLISAAQPRARLWIRALVALIVCWTVEFAQLFNAPALDNLRSTTIGHLVLGSGFDPRDLGAYALGILAAGLLTRIMPP